MAKRKAGKAVNSSRKPLNAATRTLARKKDGQRAGAKARVALTRTEVQMQERLGELTTWYLLQGLDKATTRKRAQDQMRDEA
jgi:hypothetical protein